jgi:hypothetical protein
LFIKKTIENVDQIGFNLVLDNGGYSLIEWVSIAYLAVDKERAYSINVRKNAESID